MHEIEFLPVGTSNADAICIRYGDDNGYYLHVVDGGYLNTSKTIVNHINTYYGAHYHVNHMILSHADNDHAAGLIGVFENFTVKHLWMNRPWLYADQILDNFHGNYTLEGLIRDIKAKHPYLVDLENAADEQGTIIHEAFQGSRIGPFTVMAPSKERYIKLLPDLDKTPTSYAAADSLERVGLFRTLIEKAKQWLDETWDIETLSNNPPKATPSNETCIVQLGIMDGRKVWLTGDVGPEGLTEAADYAEMLALLGSPSFVQIPHHGSRRNVTPAILDRLLGSKVSEGEVRGSAFCSVGDDKEDYPRGQVKNAFIRRGYPVHTTPRNNKATWGGVQSTGWLVRVHAGAVL